MQMLEHVGKALRKGSEYQGCCCSSMHLCIYYLTLERLPANYDPQQGAEDTPFTPVTKDISEEDHRITEKWTMGSSSLGQN